MTRTSVWRALAALAVIATSLTIAVGVSPRLGLDLRGGTQLVFEARDSPTAAADSDAADRALDVLRRRADMLGVVDPALVRSGERRIIVELPGVLDPRQAAEVIGRTAQLTIHPVLALAEENDQAAPRDESGQRLRLGPAAISGDGVSGAGERTDPQRGPGWSVGVEFRDARAWQRLTGAATCADPGDPRRRIAIVLDREIISSPRLNPSVPCGTGIPGGSTDITGSFGYEQARDLAVLIKGGALPVPLDLVEQRSVGPTLGAEAIEASAKAAITGLALTALFIITVYRLAGLLATVALAAYGLISYAALTAMGATFTLPGLAGFVLAVGIAIDACVLIFERAREEHARSSRRALDLGFKHAWSAIADSNTTTLIAAGILFLLAAGPVKGFGVTLGIGVLASLVSAMLITRVLTQAFLGRVGPKVTGIGSPGRIKTWLTRRNPSLMSGRRWWLALAGGLVVVALAGTFTRGLNFGVEFTGGRAVEFTTTGTIPAEVARQAVAGHPSAVVHSSAGVVSVRAGQLTPADVAGIQDALAAQAGKVTKLRDEFIGPSMGAELRRNAAIALGVAVAAQLAYLAVRFRWTFGAAAVLALLVDVTVVVGLFAWLNKPVDGIFLAALLTIIGYSVNDKVVVFDRVRELWTGRAKHDLTEVVNSAILRTVPRTVNTGLGALFVLIALATFGGETLHDFAIALITGIVAGTLSSSFVAGPIAIALNRFDRRPPPEPAGPRTSRPRPGTGAVL
ncbi:protein translocase subunit SecDF [Acrocarpospora corrugata]|uniref:Multifunctional fusion protein n=1 Tax=Acrocarpospora corrugata TaxID=35763 RepID=A0A5M3W1Y5_9ACTN|nr:protein translocase subunit SecD [Acrocarpospora corrugata]GES02726.1 protein translocase subunit SecDF [Acrocarpospora corrugata]